MPTIAEKLRKAREVQVVAGDITFTVRRPTDLEMIDLRGGQVRGEGLLRFLVGWSGVKESDILGPSADPHEVPYDPATAREWLADRPDLFASISTSLIEAYQAHSAELEVRLKNSTPGSNPPPPGSSQGLNQTTFG